MTGSAPPPSNDHYERACDQAIIMCSGSMRGAIKALIMANEYLEIELQELQMEIANARQLRPTAKSNAA